MKSIFKLTLSLLAGLVLFDFAACKKDKFITDSSANISLSEDSVLFDTVFTTIGSATQNIRVRNRNKQKIKISSIVLKGGTGSSFLVNVDGVKGVTFSDLEIAANDSMYIFIQVNVNPTNANSPIIISDELEFKVNDKVQTLKLEAWGQDAYYHRPNLAIKFENGSYLPYSLISNNPNADTVWKKDKPHVIYGYLVVDSAQKLTIEAGVRVYLNYKAGLWVYRYGQLQVLGKKGDEVIFQGVRREKELADEPGQWDRIWINEGSVNNKIDYAIIKNGYVGLQAERFGGNLAEPAGLTLTNTKIQNMSLWGMYCLAYTVTAGNNVISNCQEHSLTLLAGGEYRFYHCTFANFWNKNKVREKATIYISNYTPTQVLPLTAYFGNCIIDGTRDNEINADVKADSELSYVFSNCWLKTNTGITNTAVFKGVRKGSSPLMYKDVAAYNFEPNATETRVQAFKGPGSGGDYFKYPTDINGKQRKDLANGGITVGAYEFE